MPASATLCKREIQDEADELKRRREEVGKELSSKLSADGAMRMKAHTTAEENAAMHVLMATKNYEVDKLEAYSEVMYHMVMDTVKLAEIGEWVRTARGLEANAVMFVVLAFRLDLNLIAVSEEDRRIAWKRLDNEFIWMFEALMKRMQTSDGVKNWQLLTAKFGQNGC